MRYDLNIEGFETTGAKIPGAGQIYLWGEGYEIWCFPSRSVITHKYNTSVDNTTLYLYTKIVYFVRATCFDLIRSSSGPPRRQLQLLDLSSWRAWEWPYNVETCRPDKIFGSVFLEGLRMALLGRNMSPWQNIWICLLGWPEDDLIMSKHVALTKYLYLSSWRAWGWPYNVETCRPDKIFGCLLGGPEDDLIMSKHVALTKYLDLSSLRAWGWPYKV